MPNVVLIEDDRAYSEALSLALTGAGHRVRSAFDGAAGLGLAQAADTQLVISDVNLPTVDGFTLCRRLREARPRLPIVLLTSRDGEIDEALGLELGADDYISKPVSTRVLLARIAALLRRTGAVEAPASPSLIDGELVLDVDGLSVRFHGAPVPMTVSEFRLLEALVRRRNAVLSREHLLNAIRGDDDEVGDRIIDTYVRRIRRKLEAVQPGFRALETVIGAGYRWNSASGG